MTQIDDYADAGRDLVTADSRLGISGRILQKLLRNVEFGRVEVVLPSGQMVIKSGAQPGPHAVIHIKRSAMLRRVLFGGDIGFAEAYRAGDFETPDLTAVIRFAARNTAGLASTMDGTLFGRVLNRLGHMLNANTKRGSRRNIEAHYDLGNDFYKLWLDPSMLYSSAIFNHDTPSLEAAQRLKLETIRSMLNVKHGASILEIGCGWGALALHLAMEAKAKVTGITLSPSQLKWAEGRVQREGKQELVDLKLQDYRDTVQQYDGIVSIEMFEAVGEAYWPDYFNTLKRCLKPEGRAVLQVISIEETRFDHYRNHPDFIQKYVFPGGFLPSIPAFRQAIERAGLKLVDMQLFGQSYAKTLAEWRQRFHHQWPNIASLGFDERFRRLWDYYLCYCEAGFAEGTIDVGLYSIEHAEA